MEKNPGLFTKVGFNRIFTFWNVDKQYSSKSERNEKPTVLKKLKLMESEFSHWGFQVLQNMINL